MPPASHVSPMFHALPPKAATYLGNPKSTTTHHPFACCELVVCARFTVSSGVHSTPPSCRTSSTAQHGGTVRNMGAGTDARCENRYSKGNRVHLVAIKYGRSEL